MRKQKKVKEYGETFQKNEAWLVSIATKQKRKAILTSKHAVAIIYCI